MRKDNFLNKPGINQLINHKNLKNHVIYTTVTSLEKGHPIRALLIQKHVDTVIFGPKKGNTLTRIHYKAGPTS